VRAPAAAAQVVRQRHGNLCEGRAQHEAAMSRTGTILNAAVLTPSDLAHKRVLCPACMDKEFVMWPEGWDAHAAYKCKGLADGPPDARKAEFKRVLGHLFR